MSAGVVVPAAGSSSRMCGLEKLFADLGGKPVLAWCLDAFEACPDIVAIAVAVSEANLAAAEALSLERGWRKCRFCLGGSRRQDSVAAALTLLPEVDCVVVHDGDRPFVTSQLIDQGLEMVLEVDVAVAAMPAKETAKVVDRLSNVVETLDRASLRMIQTPQVFRSDVIRRSYDNAREDVTDDAALAEALGFRVRTYEGSADNIKITTPEDLLIARAIAANWRSG